MLVLVAIDAEQFPVAAVGGIVVVIMIDMMDREFPEPLSFEFPATAAAHRGKEFQRPCPVSRLTFLLFLAHIADYAVQLIGITCFL
jgi:hypothetical protein